MKLFTVLAALALATNVLVAGAPGPQTVPRRSYRIDPARSQFLVQVEKAGAFGFVAGHAHEVETRAITGAVEAAGADLSQSTVALQVDAASLRVTGRGEPPADVPQVQQTMLSDRVLDVKRYPTIRFESTSVVAKGNGASVDLSITGRLTLHGATKTVILPVHVQLDDRTVTATGHATIRQTDYGMTPVSVAGLVKVRDELGITFTIVAAAEGGR